MAGPLPRLLEALGVAEAHAAAAAATSPLTTVLLLLATVALWQLLGWSRRLRQQRRPGGGGGGATAAASANGGASGGGGGMPQQRGVLAEVVRSHHESWQREMPKTGAVSLAQAHALQWGADDLQASERPAGARDAGGEPGLPAYLWVVRAPTRRP